MHRDKVIEDVYTQILPTSHANGWLTFECKITKYVSSGNFMTCSRISITMVLVIDQSPDE